jgi:hypothetical protein
MLPAGSPAATSFRIFKGPATDAGELIYDALPAQTAGIYSADVQIDEIDQGLPVYVWLTAVNAYGESDPSEPNFYPEGCDPALDSDCDAIPDDGAPGDVPCGTGQTQGCDDNCPYRQNPGQEDLGGVGFASAPDGIGNACQCGDVSGDGVITSADMARMQYSLGAFPVPLPHPELCDVGGTYACTSADLAVLRYTLLGLFTIRQECEPALAP